MSSSIPIGQTGNQLTLPFPHQPGYRAEDFLAAESNEAALTWLARIEDWPGRRLVLWGQPGVGKTHLLHAWAARVHGGWIAASALHGLPVLPPSGGIALDDADGMADETAMLHLLNTAAEVGLPVLLAGRSPPARWSTTLPDLASRLRAIAAVEIRAPEESLLRALLVRLLADRQLRWPVSLQDWLLLRLPRTPTALQTAVARLDAAAQAGRIAVTRTLAAQVLADMIGMECDAAAPSQDRPSLL